MTDAGHTSGRLIRDGRDWIFTGAGPLAPWVPPHRLRVWEFESGKLLAMVTDGNCHVDRSPAGVVAQIREDYPGRDVEIVSYTPGSGICQFSYYLIEVDEQGEVHWTEQDYTVLAERLGPAFEVDDEADPHSLGG